jgi:hypothetical protein
MLHFSESWRSAPRWAAVRRTRLTSRRVVIFLTAGFLVGGDKQTAAELAQMKGLMVAVERLHRAGARLLDREGPEWRALDPRNQV